MSISEIDGGWWIAYSLFNFLLQERGLAVCVSAHTVTGLTNFFFWQTLLTDFDLVALFVEQGNEIDGLYK